MRRERRHVSVSLALVLLFLAVACARKLSELEPYPCATDGSCPDGRSCSPEKKCVPATIDGLCRPGETDCTAAVAGGRCALGVCGEPCDGNRVTCPDGRVCTVAPGAGGEGACVRPCSSAADCPPHLACRQLDIRDGEILGACVAPTERSVLGGSCTEDRDCTQQGTSLVCFAGVCARPCAQSEECGAGFLCPPRGGACIRDCSSDARVCEADQACVPAWTGGKRGCVGNGKALPACASVRGIFRCDGICGTSLDGKECSNGKFCPTGAACVDETSCACSTATACGTNGRKCTEDDPCITEAWWCEPPLANISCNERDIHKLLAICSCRDGRDLISQCGSRVTCEERCQDECDLVRQDCLDPTKPKCTAVSEESGARDRCVALVAAPKAEGELCTRGSSTAVGLDDCDKGLFCSMVRDGSPPEYRCRRYCDETQGGCRAGEVCVASRLVLGPSSDDALCRPKCTFPDGSECGAGARCMGVGACLAMTGGRALDALCLADGDCASPLVCNLVRNRCVPSCDPPNRECPPGYRCGRSADAGAAAGTPQAYCVQEGE